MPGFLTHRSCEIINVHSFRLPKHLAVIHFAAIGNTEFITFKKFKYSFSQYLSKRVNPYSAGETFEAFLKWLLMLYATKSYTIAGFSVGSKC